MSSYILVRMYKVGCVVLTSLSIYVELEFSNSITLEAY
jgi:hypothetical protein